MGCIMTYINTMVLHRIFSTAQESLYKTNKSIYCISPKSVLLESLKEDPSISSIKTNWRDERYLVRFFKWINIQNM